MDRKFDDRLFETAKLYKKSYALWSSVLRTGRSLKRQLSLIFQNNYPTYGFRNGFK